MSIDVRRLRDDAEFEQYLEAAIYSFNGSRDGTQLERYRRLYEREWCLGAFDGGTLVAGLTIIPFEQYLLGVTNKLGGIATVASVPERRRQGHVGALLRGALSEMRDAGQLVSGLYTPHFSLYRRYGWEIASRMQSYVFAPKSMQMRAGRIKGTPKRVGPDAWGDLNAIRRQYVAARNGAFVRDERRWRGNVFSDYFKGEHDAVMWSSAGGEARGYAVYAQQHRQTGGPFGETVLRVVDFIALDADAYHGLLGYLTAHDLVSQIVITVAEDDPIAMVVDEPGQFREPQGSWLGMMLRVVDLQGALHARPTAWDRPDEHVVVAVEDEFAPWNSGVWRIVTSEGRLCIERSEAEPGLRFTPAGLAVTLQGFLSPEAAVRGGLAESNNEQMLDAFGKMLAVPFRPFCSDDF